MEKRIDPEPLNDEDQINCPWCGEIAFIDLWELTKNKEGEVEDECSECGRTVLLTTLVSVITTATRGHGTIISWEMHKALSSPMAGIIGNTLRYMLFGPMPFTWADRHLIINGLLKIAKQVYTPEKYARSFVMEYYPGWFGVASLKPSTALKP